MIRNAFKGSYVLVKYASFALGLLLFTFIVDSVIDLESSLPVFMMIRLTAYTAIIVGLPYFLSKKIGLKKEELLRAKDSKNKLLRIRLYLVVIFVFAEVLMIQRGTWL